ncbi:hypothetical protein AURDEDRAFT_92973 [Auricularia subglabra TFB-10046 SS5]|nr:hypothetical protein AURDEDRAFT_92973 [Auricularia subglabra TFB-10046 SS5]
MSASSIWTPDAGLKLLTSPPVFDALYASCSPGALARIAKTCAGAHEAVDNYLTHTLSVNKVLSRFFTEEEILEFRNLQAQLEFLISGSTALQLLDRTIYPKSDLDLYTFPNDAEELGYWLIHRGWQFRRLYDEHITFEEALEVMPPRMEDETPERRKERADYDADVVRDVFHFSKAQYDADGEELERLEIQIIVADVCPLQGVLAFHSTVVMNYIAWDHACSLYPLGTLEERRALVTYDRGRTFERAIAKYSQRGFRIVSVLTNTQSGAFRFGPRFAGDGQCWTVKLDTTGIQPRPLEDRLDMTVNGWELARHAKHQHSYTYREACEIYSTPLHFPEFMHRYALPAAFWNGVLKWLQLKDMKVASGAEPGHGQPGFSSWDKNLPLLRERFLASLAWWELPGAV